MRTLLLASTAAFLLAGAATAQTADQTMPPGSGSTMPTDPSAPMPPAGDQTSPMPPSAPMPPSPTGTPDASMPGSSMPGTPAGAPSAPTAPGATGATPPMAPMTAAPPPPPRTDYPMCSKTVTDSCMNPSEARGKGKAMRKRR